MDNLTVPYRKNRSLELWIRQKPREQYQYLTGPPFKAVLITMFNALEIQLFYQTKDIVAEEAM